MQRTNGARGYSRFGRTPRWRAVIGVVAAMAVLVALFHGLRVAADPATPLQATVIAVDNAATDLPDPQRPGHAAHCAHCLCHAGYENPADAASLPACFGAPAYALLQDRLTRSLAGLPPFKPPRA
jgi:hypothetical protein